MGKTIYLYPTNQFGNIYAYGNTNEGEQCNLIADIIEEKLKKYDVNVLRTKKEWTSYQTGCAKVNEANPDLCICIHTNGSKEHNSTGTETYYNPNITGAKEWATLVQNKIKALKPSIDRGIKDGSYPTGANIGYINRIKCINCLVEMEFHDVYETAKWICDNKEKLAQAITEAIVEQLKLSKKTENSTPATPTNTFKNGDTVKIKKGTKYVTGETPSSWVFDETFKIAKPYEDYAALCALDNDIIIGLVYYKDLEKVNVLQSTASKTYLKVNTFLLPLWLCGGWNGTKPTKNILKMPKNSLVELIEKTNSNWYKVKYNGIVGYASAKYLK
ncbi:MAG: hypothetical protein E7480_02075 [Ruminococcaceae bacterium]|nr:hypothetical protein [Oscillospiraceae bacterium]